MTLYITKTPKKMPVKSVIGSPITCLSFNEQIECILDWANDRLSKMVCVANVHMLMEAYRTDLDTVLQNADLVTPDGMPLVWMLRLLGSKKQERVAGPDVMRAVCSAAQQRKTMVYFLGSDPYTLGRIHARLRSEFPSLRVAGLHPLPFRPLTPEEDENLIREINQSGARVLFVALGCPKQEYWMHQHKDKINAVMIGVGGAFAMYAGIRKRAPRWVQRLGLEWCYRLLQEPRRLFGRYASTIPPFLGLAFLQICFSKLFNSLLQSRRIQRTSVAPLANRYRS